MCILLHFLMTKMCSLMNTNGFCQKDWFLGKQILKKFKKMNQNSWNFWRFLFNFFDFFSVFIQFFDFPKFHFQGFISDFYKIERMLQDYFSNIEFCKEFHTQNHSNSQKNVSFFALSQAIWPFSTSFVHTSSELSRIFQTNSDFFGRYFDEFCRFFEDRKPKRKLNWSLSKSGCVVKYSYFGKNKILVNELEVDTYQALVLMQFNKDIQRFHSFFFS